MSRILDIIYDCLLKPYIYIIYNVWVKTNHIHATQISLRFTITFKNLRQQIIIIISGLNISFTWHVMIIIIIKLRRPHLVDSSSSSMIPCMFQFQSPHSFIFQFPRFRLNPIQIIYLPFLHFIIISASSSSRLYPSWASLKTQQVINNLSFLHCRHEKQSCIFLFFFITLLKYHIHFSTLLS